MVGNALAFMMLVAWPLVTVVLFQRLDVQRALIWSLLGAYMVLPPGIGINVPVLPDLDKTMIPSLAAAACLMTAGRPALALPEGALFRVLVVLFLVNPWFTTLANPEPLVEGIAFRPGLGPYDAFTGMISQGLMLLPFLLARNVLATAQAPAILMRALVAAGLVYSLPMLLEVRLSPQLNVWIYGYFAHDFGQMMRYGGFRPIMFMTHGLWVALFTFSTLISAAALARAQGYPGRMVAVVLWLAMMLVLCKSMAPLLYALALLPLLLLARPGVLLAVGAVAAALVLTFPLLRLGGLVPVEFLLATAEAIDPERAGSLRFRFDNEDTLLAHAMEKLWAGWGGWQRNLLLDPVSGMSTTITDGRWIIVLGMQGLIGYLAEFGLITLPVIAAWRTRAARADPLLAALVAMHAVMLVDLIPNATLTPLTFLFAGLILGRVEQLRTVGAGAGANHPRPGARPTPLPAGAPRPAHPAPHAEPGIRTIV